MTTSAATAGLLNGLDDAQRAAVTTDASPLAIIAAAGSGKTTVLTRRIAHRIATGDAAARHVLALTFTRDAAGELHRRLRRLDLREPIEAGTFHSVALRLLRDRAVANDRPIPHVAPDRVRLIREVLTQLRLRAEASGVVADLDWARARMVASDDFDRAARSARRRTAVATGSYADVVDAYDQLKRRRGVVDFDDLLHGLLDACERDPAWADAVRWRFRHLFVDEAQDLNPLQHHALEALRGGRPDICLVGDPRQAIYGWNGADPALLAEVEDRYPGVTVVRLAANYRCSPQVVRAAAAVLRASGQADESHSEQPGGPTVAVEQFETEHDEARAVARRVRDLLHHRAGQDLAVLARTNEQVQLLDSELSALGVPTERSAGRSPLQRVLREAYRCTSREALAEWADAQFLEGADVERRVAEAADRYLTSAVPGGFRLWVETNTPFDDLASEPSRDAVALLTFHAAKGREWWGVFVAGAEDGLVPHASAVTPAQLAEEARLFYVALTRASHHLVVTHCRARANRVASPSRWLAAVEATVADDQPAPPPIMRRERSADPLAPYREWRASIARVSGQDDRAVCSDRVLRTLAEQPPADLAELARRLGVTESAAARLKPLPRPDD